MIHHSIISKFCTLLISVHRILFSKYDYLISSIISKPNLSNTDCAIYRFSSPNQYFQSATKISSSLRLFPTGLTLNRVPNKNKIKIDPCIMNSERINYFPVIIHESEKNMRNYWPYTQKSPAWTQRDLFLW